MAISNKEKINSIRNQIDDYKKTLINGYGDIKNIKFIYQILYPYTDNQLQKMKVCGTDITFSRYFYDSFHRPDEKQRYRTTDVMKWQKWFCHMKESDYDLQFECIYFSSYGLDPPCLTECFINYKDLCKEEYFFTDEKTARNKAIELHEIYK